MLHPLSLSKTLGWLLSLALGITPAVAHKVQTAADVGATLHVEPNDSPRASEPAQTWFALTRRGGEVIPLQQCNCQLAVYSEPRTASSPPLLKPLLSAISVEQYQGIPGAAIAFPRAGAYELELSGTPKAGADFQPFELNFNVTVTGAAPASPQGPQEPGSAPQDTPETGRAIPTIFIVPAVIVSLGILWLLVRLKQK